MPYTLSHTVVALPFLLSAKRKVPIAGIAVGSMSPDALYLVALTPTGSPANTLPGIYLFCFICSLLVCLIWYIFIEKPTLEFLNLPQRRWRLGGNSLVLLSLAVLFGTSCHLLWDASSHIYGAFVINSEWWQQEFFSLPLYKWNQYSSGILGLIALFLWYLYSQVKRRHKPYRGKLAIGLLIYSVCIALFIFLANFIHASQQISDYAVRSSIGLISGSVAAMCIYASVLYLQNRVRNKL